MDPDVAPVGVGLLDVLERGEDRARVAVAVGVDDLVAHERALRRHAAHRGDLLGHVVDVAVVVQLGPHGGQRRRLGAVQLARDDARDVRAVAEVVGERRAAAGVVAVPQRAGELEVLVQVEMRVAPGDPGVDDGPDDLRAARDERGACRVGLDRRRRPVRERAGRRSRARCGRSPARGRRGRGRGGRARGPRRASGPRRRTGRAPPCVRRRRPRRRRSRPAGRRRGRRAPGPGGRRRRGRRGSAG